MTVSDIPITAYEEFREFRWGGAVIHQSIAFAEQIFALEATANNQTRLIHREVFKGFLVRFLNLKIPFTEAFERMDRALKAVVEEDGHVPFT